MRKLILLLALTVLIPSTTLLAQSKKIKEKYNEYLESGYFKVDGGNIVVNAVIDGVEGSPEEIYIKVKNFFARNYTDAKSVLQTEDKEAGVLIGKGYYKNIFIKRYMGVINTVVDTYHILRVDIKEGRIRAICSSDIWDVYDGNNTPFATGKIVDYAPFTKERLWDKGKQMEALVALVERMHESIAQLESVVKKGGVSIENEDW